MNFCCYFETKFVEKLKILKKIYRLQQGLLKASQVMFLGTFIPLSILGHLSYLGTPHNWDLSYPGTPHTWGPLIPAEFLEFP